MQGVAGVVDDVRRNAEYRDRARMENLSWPLLSCQSILESLHFRFVQCILIGREHRIDHKGKEIGSGNMECVAVCAIIMGKFLIICTIDRRWHELSSGRASIRYGQEYWALTSIHQQRKNVVCTSEMIRVTIRFNQIVHSNLEKLRSGRGLIEIVDRLDKTKPATNSARSE